MIAVIEIALLSIFGFFLAYLALLSILAMTARKQGTMKSSRFRRIAVVVPAHDEELTIGRTLQSVLEVDYPRECFDVIVVADNCMDRTAEIAESFGAVVHKRQDPALQGKGYALRWCFDFLLSGTPSYDAVVVIDADSVMSGNFLQVMNSYLERGAQAIQSNDMVELQPDSWSAEVTRVGFTLFNYVRPLGRRVIGCSAGLRGNGMCFASETLRSVPWRAYSLAEDLEYGLILLMSGIKVVFAPEASVRAAMPKNANNAQAQRARWEAGRFPLIRKYVGRLLGTALNQASFGAFDAFVDLVIPPLVNLLAYVVVFLFVSLLLWGIGIEQTARFAWLWLTLIALAAIHVLVGLYAAGADRRTYRVLLYLPRYTLWKLSLYARLLRRGQTRQWIRTTRESLPARQEATEGLKR
ncbi:MAG: glycosyltransferase family 2 protein [Bacteroidota bacterium]